MYAQRKIGWDSPRLMPEFTCWYSGIWRYSAKSRSHSAWLSGGRAPLIGAHSMIESPDSVSRVIAPMTAMASTIAQQPSSHRPTALPEPRRVERKSLVWGKSVSVRVDLGGYRIKKK